MFSFQKCTLIDKNDKSCLSYTEADKWFEKNDVYVEFYETKNLIDFTNLDHYELSSMEYMKIRDHLSYGLALLRQSSLRLQDTTLYDSAWDPFDRPTDHIKDMKLQDSNLQPS